MSPYRLTWRQSASRHTGIYDYELLIRQTKSRARHCNDNALVEGKNGSIIHKHMGRMHIAQKHADAINESYRAYLNPYLNYH